MRSPTLSERFDGRRNSLNLLRLLLAASVIVWHSARLGGFEAPPGFGGGRLEDIGVDGFFVLSGFLISRSWDRAPDWRTYAWHRGLRILPGFWACLGVTAFVIAPIAWLHQHGTLDGYLHERPHEYLTQNFALVMNEYKIGSTPAGIPYTLAWDGSLWTLYWEALCYVGIGLLGVLVGKARQGALGAAFVCFWLLSLMPAVAEKIHATLGWVHFDGTTAARFGLMFTTGALMYQGSNRIPIARKYAVLAGCVLAAALTTTHYRVFACVALAYLLLWLAVSLPHRAQRIGATNDLSYGTYIYAFPVQQLLATFHVQRLGFLAFLLASLVCTVPFAALSWLIVESPALRLKRIRFRSAPNGPQLSVPPAAEGAPTRS